MTRILVLGAATVVGVLVGGGTMLAVQGGQARDGAPSMVRPRPSPSPTVAPIPPTGTDGPDEQELLLAWTSGGLPSGLGAIAATIPGVTAAAVVGGDPVDLVRSLDGDGKVVDEPAPGWFIPIDAIAVDPSTFAAVVPAADRATVASLGAAEALLGDTSARLRRIGVGGRLELAGGGVVAISGVVPDETIGGAELAVDRATGALLGITTERALLVAHAADRAAVEAALASAVPAGVPVRFRARGETPYLRAGDAVLPQIVIKDVFGEFAYRPGPAGERAVELDPEWVAANIGEAELPLLGRVRCHRAVLPAIEAAMRDLELANLASVVGPEDFDGCFVPRLVRPGAPLSHHSWGIAVDLHYADNPTAVVSAQDPRLVEALLRAGFGWGGGWLVPDPAHFEYVAPPSAR
ncbi:MAG: M15 family metallopeptidase [Acidimicrobiales bacterium]